MRPLPLLIPLLVTAVGNAAEPEPMTVMVVGTFHMANPGHDLHNQEVDDVLAPARQKELVALAEALAKFRPTSVAVEWPADLTQERYAKFLAGTLPPSKKRGRAGRIPIGTTRRLKGSKRNRRERRLSLPGS